MNYSYIHACSTTGTGSLPGVKSGRGVTLTPHRLLVPLLMKELSYISTPPMGCTACTEPQCLYKGALYLYLFMYVTPCSLVCDLKIYKESRPWRMVV